MVRKLDVLESSQLPVVRKRKYSRSCYLRMERTHTREDRSHAGAAQTTAAIISHAFPVAASKICKEHTAECAAQEHQFCAPEQRFRIPECSDHRQLNFLAGDN
jgi:hypothetical protein